MLGAFWAMLSGRLPELWLRTGEHLVLTGVSTGLAILLGVPLGILAARASKLRGVLLGAVGILQTIPSLAMLAILLVVLRKIGAVPAVIALTLYALLPIVRNTLAGLEGIGADVDEAARGIGMTPRQQLLIVEIPMALPIMVAGIRTAAVVGVGIATLSAFIGAGGLGQFINRGLALSNPQLIMLGAVPAAILALLVDFTLGAAEWGTRPTRQSERNEFKTRLKPLAIVSPLLLVVLGIVSSTTAGASVSPGGSGATTGTIRVGSKNFTEQFVLGELIAQLIEAKTDLAVERRFNLGGTMICHESLVSEEIDVYVEYSGTGLTAILKEAARFDPDETFDIVREGYRKRFGAEWLDALGFNNTFALTVRARDAKTRGWTRISDLAGKAGQLRAGFTSEFAERPDGYPGLARAYGLKFGTVRDLDPSILYEAIARKEVDVICAFATDGRIAAYKLKPLIDDARFFPPYHAAPVVRGSVLARHPEIREALAPLSGLLSDASMQQLNFKVDEEKRGPREVAREFLDSRGLLD
ncbi:MAG: ABC transporter permease subunit [Phycisphaerae bacterium]|nr:ABC transporter permease subunit [Phycisphaerae bacterium]